MPLTKEKREEIVGNVITNCDCWNEEDKETLNSLSDDKLVSLQEHTENEDLTEEEINDAIEAALTDNVGGKDRKKKMLSFLQEEDLEAELALRKKNKEKPPVAATKNVEGETTVKTETKPLTDEEHIASLPPGVRSVVQNAMDFDAEQKTQLIEAIVANDSNPFTKEFLEAKGTKELQGLAELAGSKKSGEPAMFVRNYEGQAAPATGRQVINEADENDILPLPENAWEEKESKSAAS